MRIIKLSTKDDDFKTREGVKRYFLDKLPNRKPAGRFLLTKRAIGQDEISPGETLVFTYKGECVYKARADSPRKMNSDQGRDKYPYYFVVNVPSIKAIQWCSLKDIQHKLEQEGLAEKNLVNARAWPKFSDGGRQAQIIDAYIESKGRIQPLPNVGKGFKFQPGFRPKLSATKASRAQKELDVNLRHNELQEDLYDQLYRCA